MASLATLPILDRDDAPAQAPAPRITPEQRAALTHFRMSAMACRVAAPKSAGANVKTARGAAASSRGGRTRAGGESCGGVDGDLVEAGDS